MRREGVQNNEAPQANVCGFFAFGIPVERNPARKPFIPVFTNRVFWVRDKRGQIFPFLTVVLILMVVLVMAFVNTAQVNVRKVGTMNAADAGAMAGAAAIASAANAIADMNVNVIIPTYLADLAALSTPG